MCGIVGYVGPPDVDALVRMRDALRHRGPDEAGELVDGTVSLAQRRLSIVDVAGGHQPMSTPDGDVVVVFNGEIYNHPTLAARLEAEGCRYASRSDTESILHAYRKHGTACPEHLDGMFAFVLYDRRRRILFGARDRMGKKPLYYTTQPFGAVRFAFASEPKAFREHPELAKRLRLSDDGLVSYLLNDYVLGRRSIFRHVGRLQPGSAFAYGLPGSETEGFREWRYWSLAVGANASAAPSADEAAERILTLLGEAVERRLMSDVPVGVFLSGGIDSSAITAILHRLGHGPLRTFSIGFDERSYDESCYAHSVARRYGAEHHSRTFRTDDLVDRMPAVAAQMDEPFADPSVLPTSLLSELAAQHVKVVLGGDGADELFAGYDPFKALGPARWYRRFVPRLLHERLLRPLTTRLRDSDRNLSLSFKVARFLRGTHVASARRMAVWMGPFDLAGLRRLLPDVPLPAGDEALFATHIDESLGVLGAQADDVDRGLDFYQRCYLPDDILVKMDRASMLHSLEVRAPFLDTALVEYVNRLPSRFKYRRGTTKWILKRALLADGLLPESLVTRKKKGFGIPVARWMRVELHDWFRKALIDEWPASLDMFSRAEIRRLWERHVRREANHYKELWALLMLAMWSRHADVAGTQRHAAPPRPKLLDLPAGRRSTTDRRAA